MTELQQYLAEEVAEDHVDGIITRREAMRRLGLLGRGRRDGVGDARGRGRGARPAADTAHGHGHGHGHPDGATSDVGAGRHASRSRSPARTARCWRRGRRRPSRAAACW